MQYFDESVRVYVPGRNNPKIVCIGGGHGLSAMLRGLKRHTRNITAIVTVADDGGGSGMLREDLGMPPPGDIRNCILALANTEPPMEKLLNSANLEFHPLIECDAYVYLWKGHPLAEEACITMKQLENYPCLAFEQGDNSSFYLSEELLPTNEYSQIIHANDRATMLNLMVGLNGYTLCSGLICEDLNGNDYRAVPFKNSEGPEENKMEVGYVTRKNLILSKLGEMYVNALKEYLKTE